MDQNLGFLLVIDAMIRDQGEVWLGSEDFKNRSEKSNAVVVTDNPEHCWRLLYVDGQWQKHEDRLNWSEMAEFFAAFGSHWTVALNSFVDTSSGLIPIRAFIKNGRKRSRFSISIDIEKTIKQEKVA